MMSSTVKQDKALQYEYFSTVRQQKVDWLWYPYIPYGKITILQGDPGEGKSTFMLNIAALLTNGKPMPDGFAVSGPQQVIYQTAEDNIADTVKPRLIQAGADCQKIAYIVDEESPLTLEDARIDNVIQQTGAKLFILDPLQAYLSQDSDMFAAGRIRQQLKMLSDIAAKHHCAVVSIGHMNKASGEKNLYRGLGSIDIAAVARSVLMISRDKEKPNIRYMFPVKTSLAPEGKPIAFRLDHKRGICWLCDEKVDLDSISDRSEFESKGVFAQRIIREILEHHDVPSVDVMSKLEYMGISKRTAMAAKKELGIVSYKKESTWYWHLNLRERY